MGCSPEILTVLHRDFHKRGGVQSLLRTTSRYNEGGTSQIIGFAAEGGCNDEVLLRVSAYEADRCTAWWISRPRSYLGIKKGTLFWFKGALIGNLKKGKRAY